jgi:hypothetical protein
MGDFDWIGVEWIERGMLLGLASLVTCAFAVWKSRRLAGERAAAEQADEADKARAG